jgi:membrane-bound ClpP family serine protease
MTAICLLLCAAIVQPAQPAADNSARFLEVPLRGVFGAEITAPGIRDAIRAAKSKKAAAVVFTFDTPGGRVLDADAIAAVMDAERSAPGGADLKYYALITQAFSASVWPLSRCDRIFFAPGAAAGAAVAFRESAKTGNIEVDAKFNAAMAASVSAAAESHGQSGVIYRAMMLKDARLFGYKDASGEYHLSDQPPASDAKDIEEIDSRCHRACLDHRTGRQVPLRHNRHLH